MKKKSNATKMLESIKLLKSKRVKTSLYLSETIYNDFKNAVDKEGLSYSEVLETLMFGFIEDLRRK